MDQHGTKSSFYEKVWRPQLNGALQRGTDIMTKGWPPGFIVEEGYRFHILDLLHDRAALPFTVVEETRADSEGFAIVKITPPLEVNTANQAVLYSDKPVDEGVLDAIH